MEQQIQNILAQVTTKTNKIKQLINLGLTRTQIAQLVTNGNYGFVQNVYAKMKAQGLLNNLGTIIAVSAAFTRKFGVEFEAYNVTKEKLNNALNSAGIRCRIEGYNHNDSETSWKIVSDASLHGNNTFELVSPILKGESGIQELEKVCRILNECGAKVNKSCGTHVHMDARNMPLKTWKNIYKNYARLENVIDAFMPLSRRDNFYCNSFRNIRNFESKINSATSLNEIATIFGSRRYYKINPVSYSRHNTCEFRQHSGTIEFEKIGTWVRFLNNLIDFSANNLITEATLEGLKQFNSTEIVNFFKTRTNKFAA
ncbi:MAG: amidoligase enzyme [Odoribacter splanchnicus]|nr:amidoligase enzyme [Odoribacter splanchnicus]